MNINTIKRFLICGIIFFSITIAGAQINDVKPKIQFLQDYIETSAKALKTVSTAISERRKEHQLYINPSWSNCIILMSTGEVYSCKGRYSVLDGAIEILIEGKPRMVRPSRISGAFVDNKLFATIPSNKLKGIEQDIFLESVIQGPISLYIRHILKSRMQGSNELTLGVTGEKVYFISEESHLAVLNSEIESTPTKKKLMKKLEEHNLKGIELLKKAKWRKGSIEDMIPIIKQINALNE